MKKWKKNLCDGKTMLQIKQDLKRDHRTMKKRNWQDMNKKKSNFKRVTKEI